MQIVKPKIIDKMSNVTKNSWIQSDINAKNIQNSNESHKAPKVTGSRLAVAECWITSDDILNIRLEKECKGTQETRKTTEKQEKIPEKEAEREWNSAEKEQKALQKAAERARNTFKKETKRKMVKTAENLRRPLWLGIGARQQVETPGMRVWSDISSDIGSDIDDSSKVSVRHIFLSMLLRTPTVPLGIPGNNWNISAAIYRWGR